MTRDEIKQRLSELNELISDWPLSQQQILVESMERDAPQPRQLGTVRRVEPSSARRREAASDASGS